MKLADSRRLTGPNLITDGPGAILDVALEGQAAESVIRGWQQQVRRLLDAIGWEQELTAYRQWQDGVSLVITAPIDALYAATEVNEWAFEFALIEDPPDFMNTVLRFKDMLEHESNPMLRSISQMAQQNGVPFFSDDDFVTLGWGKGSQTFPVESLPHPGRIHWDQLSRIPTAIITGTNGKSTTVRLLNAMGRAAGLVTGVSSTDWLKVNDEIVDEGDYSGPGGARAILKHHEVEMALLETARGGILRRGLVTTGLDAALVTNVANDHLGEYGIFDVAALAQTKLVVAKGLKPDGVLVVNADDPMVSMEAELLEAKKLWFSLDEHNPKIQTHLAANGLACFMRDGSFIYAQGNQEEVLLEVTQAPITVGGAAKHNVANALAAIGVAKSLGLSSEAIVSGLTSFENTATNNPGRTNIYNLNGVTVVADFAHNPHGMEALVAMVDQMPAQRKLLIIGQAGDRDDASIVSLALQAWKVRPDLLIVKEMEEHLRGRNKGEVPQLIERTLLRAGAPPEVIEHAPSEYEAVRYALRWARPGDLLLLLLHAERQRVLELLNRLKEENWKSGESF